MYSGCACASEPRLRIRPRPCTIVCSLRYVPEPCTLCSSDAEYVLYSTGLTKSPRPGLVCDGKSRLRIAQATRTACARALHGGARFAEVIRVRVLNIFRAEMFTPVFAISHGVRPISPGGARVARTARAALLSPRSGEKLGVLFRNRSIFVPRGLARRPLRLTGVRVQRWVRQQGSEALKKNR